MRFESLKAVIVLSLLSLWGGLVTASEITPPRIPDEELIDQDGRKVKLYSDLIKGRLVAVNFVFTSCSTVCAPMGAMFGELQSQAKDVRLISVSLDPANDTPARLKAFAARFKRGKNWTLLTGDPARVARAVRALGGMGAAKEEHVPATLLGEESAGKWQRVFGLVPARELAKRLIGLRSAHAGGTIPSLGAAAASYFTQTELLDQDGRRHRFYADLIRGKIVLINFAFTSCKGGCSPITKNLAAVQKLLSKRVGKDVHMLTLSVDPSRDSRDRLKQFAQKFGAGPGWYFLSGPRTNVELVLKKLGGYTPNPDEHPMTLLIGDDRTGNWVKANALDVPANIVRAVEGLNQEQLSRR